MPVSLSVDCVDVNTVDFSYPFLKGIDVDNPPPSITIPTKYLDAMANMERQYWEIKARRYNILIFFKKGKFYELYDYDAVIANKEFGLKMVFDTTNRGKMRLAGVPEQSLSEWARLFVFRGYKVGRVEQMMKSEENSPGAAAAKIVPRELVEVLTPGTLTDPAMLSDHNEVFLVAFAAQPSDGVVDAFAVDLSRHVVYWCPCGDAIAVRRFRERQQQRQQAVGAGAFAVVKQEPSLSLAHQHHDDDRRDATSAAQWNEAAMRSVTALLQQLHPREVIVPAADGSTSKTDAHHADHLTKWIQSDGLSAEPVMMPLVGRGAGGGSGRPPTAKETIVQYLRFLKLERELPLIETASVYDAHVFSSSVPTVGVKLEKQAHEGQKMDEDVLAWERRHAEGLVLDSATVSNLELVTNLHDGSEKQSLHECLNHCITNGGKRLFRAWTLRPSASAMVIQLRQDAVRFLLASRLCSNGPLWGHGSGSGNGGVAAAADSLSLTPCAVSVGSTQDQPSEFSPSPVKVSSQQSSALSLSPSSSTTTTSGFKRPRESASGNAFFHQRFANMLAIDFERSLSRLAEIKNDQQLQTISYVDPLVKYRKNLDIILSSVQAFSEMVEWAAQLHAQCRRFLSHSASPPNTSAGLQTIGGNHMHSGNASSSSASSSGGLPVLLEQLLLSVEGAADAVMAMEELFDRQVARETGLLTPALGTSTAYDAAFDRLAQLEAKLHAYRHQAQTEVFGGASVSFVDLGKDLFLLEVAAQHAPKMTPPGMVERARSGKSVKYVVDALAGLVEAHKEATAAKSAALLTVLQSVAAKMCDQCPTLYAATSALSYLDCLINLARLSGKFPNTCFPEVVVVPTSGAEEQNGNSHTSHGDDGAFLEATDLVHPLLTSTHSSAAAAVPNSITLDAAHGRLLVLTGPNMAGKSTLMRTVAVNLLLAQLGGPVLASRLRFAPVTRIFTRIGARDATQKGQSTLYVELNETAEILRGATGRSLCLIDELGRGTSTHDGLAIAHATLQALKRSATTPPLTIFSTHYHSLAQEEARCQQQKRQPQEVTSRHAVQLGYMDFALMAGSVGAPAATAVKENNLNSSNEEVEAPSRLHARAAVPVPKITFLYRLVPGICDRSYGVEVALMAGVSPSLVALAREKSAELARITALHEDMDTVGHFMRLRE